MDENLNLPEIISPDGAYRWTGTEWVPVAPEPILSPDGAYRWTGTEWVPAAPAINLVPVAEISSAADSCEPVPTRTTSPSSTTVLPQHQAPVHTRRSSGGVTYYGAVFGMARQVRSGANILFQGEQTTKIYAQTTHGVFTTKTRIKEDETTWSFFKTTFLPLVLFLLSLVVMLVGVVVWFFESPIRGVSSSDKT